MPTNIPPWRPSSLIPMLCTSTHFCHSTSPLTYTPPSYLHHVHPTLHTLRPRQWNLDPFIVNTIHIPCTSTITYIHSNSSYSKLITVKHVELMIKALTRVGQNCILSRSAVMEVFRGVSRLLKTVL